MNQEIWLADLVFKSKTGTHTEKDMVIVKAAKEEIEKDSYTMFQCFHNKLVGFMKGMAINAETGFPKLESVVYIKKLGDKN